MSDPIKEAADWLARVASQENGYAMSLRQQAAWVREAVDPASDETQRIELQDIDTDELDAAADEIDALMARIAELEKERDDYVRISATWCSMMDGKLLEQKARAERAEAALATARRENDNG